MFAGDMKEKSNDSFGTNWINIYNETGQKITDSKTYMHAHTWS